MQPDQADLLAQQVQQDVLVQWARLALQDTPDAQENVVQQAAAGLGDPAHMTVTLATQDLAAQLGTLVTKDILDPEDQEVIVVLLETRDLLGLKATLGQQGTQGHLVHTDPQGRQVTRDQLVQKETKDKLDILAAVAI